MHPLDNNKKLDSIKMHGATGKKKERKKKVINIYVKSKGKGLPTTGRGGPRGSG